ncbi:MAG: hypothetical protein LH468_09225 [Nocardioides sp.]|nr:hypothetical protein [Nocardioides sp.]
MPTVDSSTETSPSPSVATAGILAESRRAVADVGHLLRFRSSTLKHRSTTWWVMGVLAVATLALMTVPHFVEGAGNSDRAVDLVVLMPTAFAGFLALAIAAAVASGGGRELLSREHGVAFPVSPTTDYLGALLLAPLNIAWILQAWVLLGSMAYATTSGQLLAAQVGTVLWLIAATALGQLVAWTVEWVRRSPRGSLTVRMLGLALLGAAVMLQVAGLLVEALESLPTLSLVVGLVQGFTVRWVLTIAALVALLLGATALGAVPAHLAARRPTRDEAKVESGRYAARAVARSPLLALVRTDRSSIWRAVPMRRGIAVLAIGPGLVALAGDLDWAQMTILPGLVASGGALLFGVNSWCLDGRGGLWRESLPVPAWQVFTARAYALGEFLVVGSSVTLLLAGLRAGVPSVSELTALLCTWLIVVLQVVSSAMRWSSKRPYAVDLRSARATPAPPASMVTYSAKLAVTTTMTSLVFSGLARTDHPEVSILAAAPFVLWSSVRMLHARDAWVDPVSRARVVTTVAG